MPGITPHWWSKPPAILGMAVVALSVGAAVGAGILLDRYLQTSPYVSLFLCAIMFATWFGGAGAGLLATALSILAFNYFFIPPTYTLAMESKDILRIVLFAVTAAFVVILGAAQKNAVAALQRARDDLQAAVQALETLNVALRTENAERVRAEQRIRAAERELQLTIDSIPVLAASYRADGQIDFVNQTWRTYTGLTQGDLEGHRWGVAIHPDDLPAVEQAWRTHLPKGEPFEIEQRMRRGDGAYRWHLIRRVPLRDDTGAVIRWYGAGYDIEDHKRSEAALRRSEAYLAEGQRVSKTGTFGWKLAGREIYLSEEAYRIWGLDPASPVTVDMMLQRIHPDDREIPQRELARVAHGQLHYDFEHRIVMPDGTVKTVHVRSHRTTYDSGEAEIIGAIMDVTEGRKAQEALQKAQAELAHVTRVTTLGEMSASIAHEVNQPLAAIVTSGEAGLRWLTRDTPDIAEAQASLRRIVSDANRASEVIRRVRELAKKAHPDMAELDVNAVIQEVLTLVQGEIVSHRVSLRRQFAAELPPVRGDRIQLQQVILNLVLNGVQALAPVSDRMRALTIRTQRDAADNVLVVVEDAGIGTAPENLERLFNAFYTTKPNGMGMGLSICRSIIELHGGRVWASRNNGPGMTFQFTIPAFERAVRTAAATRAQ